MKKKNNRRGFTMAELLVVVAIIVILTGVSFVAVQAHQRNLAQLEADTVAKEIFFAAQNHLTMAEGQGYLSDIIDYGTPTSYTSGDTTITENVYYVTMNTPGSFPANSILNQMLPFGSIDDTVRSAGNYVIRYQSKPARVLDVWYGRRTNELYAGRYDADPCLISIEDLASHKYDSKVIGWYGGDEALEGGAILNAPYIEVENAERLTVRIKTVDVNKDAEGNEIKDAEGNAIAVTVKLIIRGKTSGAMAAIPVLPDQNQRVKASTTDGFDYDIILDDITMAYDTGRMDGGHFADITTDMASTTSTTVPAIDVLAGTAFIPGENITVQAVAFSNTALASIDYSNEWTTNSLFADAVDADEENLGSTDSEAGPRKALISNMRHLANLDRMISGVNTVNTGKLTIITAQQTADLIWSSKTKNPDAFTEAIQNACVYKKGESTHTDEGCWLPLNIDYDLIYEGAEPGDTDAADDADKVARSHSITGVKVSAKDGNPAGLFGTVAADVTIRNLELIDFDITAASGNAGALAGTLSNPDGAKVSVENVLARNTDSFDKLETATVKSGSGAAGGLIGKMTGADVAKCAAALVVESTNGNAGGLVGESNGGKIESSYSGGHTNAHSYYKNGAAIYNVTAGGYAGGLVGNAGGTNIDYCYSTCSASGDTAGGLVGRTEGLVQNSYATGLVNGNNAGAFAGYVLSNKQPVNCRYLEIINEITTGGAVNYLPPVPDWSPSDETVVPTGSVKLTGVSRGDYSAASYAVFSGEKTDWKDAIVYDDTLKEIFYAGSDGEKQPKYNFNTVERLGDDTVIAEADETDPVDFVAIHYGDWPAPETLVVNE